MASISRLIVGLVCFLFGIGLIIFSFEKTLLTLIYGIPLVVVGIVILFNRSEDKIEERKDIKAKGGKK